MNKPCHIVFAHANHGKTFYLVNRAIENASAGNKVLYVNIEMRLDNVINRFRSYKEYNTCINNIDIKTINTVAECFMVASQKIYDVVVIDLPSLWMKDPNYKSFYTKLTHEITKHSVLIFSNQLRRDESHADVIEINSEEFFSSIATSISVLKKDEDIFVESFIKVPDNNPYIIGGMWYIDRDLDRAPRFEVFGI